jgi:hypothetical protein
MNIKQKLYITTVVLMLLLSTTTGAMAAQNNTEVPESIPKSSTGLQYNCV